MKKIFAVIVSAVMLICLAGCSGNYVMTEDDIAVQKSIEGYWLADDSTGYNEYDGNGNFLALTVVEFTSDYKYLLHVCMPGDGQADGYVMTYDPIAYSFEDKMFRVDVDGTPNYARVSVSEDGQIMYWITEDQTDRYNRLTDERAAELGIPPYDPAYWEEKNSKEENVTEPEAGDVTESETGSVSENNAEGSAADAMSPAVPDPEEKDYNLLDYTLDPSVKFDISGEGSDHTKNPVVIAETEDGEIVLYGIYIDGKYPFVFIEKDGSIMHDGMTNIYEQAWLTPRNILPQIMYSDIDSDGEKELAVSYYVGSGTGISVEQLVIYEMREGGYFSSGFEFDAADMLESAVSVSFDNIAHTVTFTLLTNGESVSYDTLEDYPNGLDSVEWGSNIGYKFDGNEIILTAHPSANLLSYEGMPKITAKIAYSDTDGVINMSLENITIDKEF
ncbi:MAG: YgdI/YgdR family lipoprotein [Oscillospiraceae bacterium]|nr:YgdI/YgdR family lipoprotein [Oscillospiraceae bacterium]